MLQGKYGASRFVLQNKQHLEKQFERMVNITEEKLYNLGRWFVDIFFNDT
jgi:hypothetical protein